VLKPPVLVALLVATVSLTACGGAQSRFEAHLKRGQSYFAAGDYTKASIEFRNALQIEPQNYTARLAQGRTAEKLQKPRDAYGLYQSVVDAQPDNLEARQDLARLLVSGGSADQALKVIEPGLAKHPDDAVLLTLRAAARVLTKNRDGAIADADRALKLSPDNEEAIQVRAGLYKQMGDLAAARTLVQSAVVKSPKSMPLRDILVDLALTAGDEAQAEQQLNDAIKLAPENPRYRFRLAVLYSRSKKLDEAQHVLESAVAAIPKNDEIKLSLIDFLAQERTPAVAQQTLRGFIAKNPDDYVLRMGLGTLLQRSGALPEAIQTYKDIVSRDGEGPNGLAARDRLADIAAAQGHDDESLKLVGEVLQKNAHDNDALARRAAIELKRSDPAAAIGDLRALLRDRPQSVSVERMLAQAYVANGQPALAEQALHAAMDVAPADTGSRVQLAQLLVQSQRTDEAVTLLEETVRRSPTDVPVRIELIRAYLEKRNFAAARTAAEDLKTLHPDLAAASYLAGMAASGLNKPDDAQKEFEHALVLAPKAVDALTALARLDVARGHMDKAIELVKAHADASDTNAAVVNLLGELYMAQNNASAASETFTRATTMAPTWWLPYRNLAIAKLSAKDRKGAVATYELGLKTNPYEPQLLTELALIYEGDGRVDDAIALYDAAYKHNPHVQPVANNLAMLLVTYKKDRPSLDRARDLTADFVSSPDGKLLDTNGWVRVKRGEYAEALPVLGRAAERAPTSREIRYHLAMAELYLGQTDRARADLETALQGAAKFYGSDDARVTLASLKGGKSG
jgi:tetratricopeptide (TPR) repeat protein